jgi:hypothetical protein
LPFLKVRVLDNVCKIVRDDRLEEAEVRVGGRATLEVLLLSALQELRSTLDSEEKCIREAIRGEAE